MKLIIQKQRNGQYDLIGVGHANNGSDICYSKNKTIKQCIDAAEQRGFNTKNNIETESVENTEYDLDEFNIKSLKKGDKVYVIQLDISDEKCRILPIKIDNINDLTQYHYRRGMEQVGKFHLNNSCNKSLSGFMVCGINDSDLEMTKHNARLYMNKTYNRWIEESKKEIESFADRLQEVKNHDFIMREKV